MLGKPVSPLQQINRGLVINFLTAISRSFKFLFYVFLGNFMGQKTFGLFLLCWSTVEIGSKILMMGLDTALLRELSIAIRLGAKDSFRRTFVTSFKIYGTIGTCAAFLMIPGSVFIANHIYLKPQLAEPLCFLAFSVVLRHLANLFINGVMANKNMMPQLIVNGISEPIVYILVIILAHQTDDSLKVLSMYHGLGNAVLLLISIFYFIREYKPKDLRAWLAQKPDFNLLKVSLPLGLSEITSGFLLKLPVFTLGRVLPVAEAALFAIGHQVAFAVMTIRASLTGMIYPSIGEYGTRDNIDIVKKRMHHFTLWGAKACIPLFLVLIHFHEQILGLLKVKDPHGFNFVPEMIFSLSVFTVLGNAEFVMMMLKKGVQNFILHIVWGVVFGILYLHLGKHPDLNRLANIYLAQLFSLILAYWIALNINFRKETRFHPFHKGLTIDGIALTVCGGLTLLFDRCVQSFESLPIVAAIISMGVIACGTFLFRQKLGSYFSVRFRTEVV